jgi:hypothetical protein
MLRLGGNAEDSWEHSLAGDDEDKWAVENSVPACGSIVAWLVSM